jgi:hypothetical protein
MLANDFMMTVTGHGCKAVIHGEDMALEIKFDDAHHFVNSVYLAAQIHLLEQLLFAGRICHTIKKTEHIHFP